MRALVLDLDGTIVDSAPGIAAALDALGVAHRPVSVARVRQLVALSAEALIKGTLAVPDDGIAEALTSFRGVYAKDPCRPEDLFPDVVEVLEASRSRGWRIGICTNKPQRLADIVISRLGLSTLVDVVVGATEDRPLKPEPDMLLHVLSELGTTRAVYVGDTSTDAITAFRAKVLFVAATYGYGEALSEHTHAAAIASIRDLPDAADSLVKAMS